MAFAGSKVAKDFISGMDYLLDKYVFNFFSLTLSEETKKAITSKAVDVLQVADWTCKAQDVRKLFNNNPSLLLAELVFFTLYILTLVHAARHGRRYLFTWFGVNFIATAIEFLRFFNPAWDVVWHAQGILTFLGMRVPIFVNGVYQFVFYVSYVFAKRLYLRWWAEASAAALISVILIFPVTLLGTKLLWFQWHNDDIAVADRWLFVPWTSLLFISCVSCCFMLLLHTLRKYLVPERYDWKLFVREYFCSCCAGIGAVLLTTWLTEFLVHTFRGIWNINMGIPTFAILGLFALLFFSNDRHNSKREARLRVEAQYWFDELSCAICIHFLLFMILPLIVDPGDIVAEGLHQPIGLCNVTESYSTAFGTVTKRKKYFCPYEGKNLNTFDFHCLPNRLPPQLEEADFIEWYPICGKEYDNRWEYVLLTWSFSLLSIALLYQIGVKSGTTPVDLVKLHKTCLRNSYRPDPYERITKSFLEEQDPGDFSSSSSENGDETAGIGRTLDVVSKGSTGLQQPGSPEKFGTDLSSEQPLQQKETAENAASSAVARDSLQNSSSPRTTKVKTSSTYEYIESPRALRSRKRNA